MMNNNINVQTHYFITKNDIYKLCVANDINKYSCDTNVENILCSLFNECVHTIFKIN